MRNVPKARILGRNVAMENTVVLAQLGLAQPEYRPLTAQQAMREQLRLDER